jgi:hypothetical protein
MSRKESTNDSLSMMILVNGDIYKLAKLTNEISDVAADLRSLLVQIFIVDLGLSQFLILSRKYVDDRGGILNEIIVDHFHELLFESSEADAIFPVRSSAKIVALINLINIALF